MELLVFDPDATRLDTTSNSFQALGHQFTRTFKSFRILSTFEQFSLIAVPSVGPPLTPFSWAPTTFPHGQALFGNCFK